MKELKNQRTIPPQFFLYFFRWFCHPKLRDSIEGDLMELYDEWVKEGSKAKADLKFVRDVLLLFRPSIIKPVEGYRNLNTYGMYKSYFKIGWRTLLKNKGYSLSNIGGLALGLTACMLIGLYVHYELSYDQFHEKADLIYRVNSEIKFGDNHLDLAVTSPIFGETAKSELAQIEQTTRLRWYGGFLVKKGNENIQEGNVGQADSTFFDVFTLPMIYGNPKKALTEPNSIVVTESVAKKYFESTDVLGETLVINNTESRKITGVIKDIPQNSHFRFTSFIPMVEDPIANENTWSGSQNYNTYLLLRPNTDFHALTVELNKMQDRHLEPELKMILNKTLTEFNNQGDFFKVSLTGLTDIHLHPKPIAELYGSGNIEYLYMFSVIAIFILVIAIINFMNLATARSAKRAREVGVRKVLGSQKSSLIGQFITESFITCFMATTLAIGAALLLIPYFNELTGQTINPGLLMSTQVIVGLFGLAVVVGLLAGSYPAFYLSAFEPVVVLKGSKGTSMKKSFFRNTLVVFQFSASVILIAGTLIVFNQMRYIGEKDLGYKREHMLILNHIDQLGERVEPLKNKLQQVTGVDNATVTGFLPVNYYRTSDTFFSTPSVDIKDAISVQKWVVDEDYISTMGMQLTEGRNFSENSASDTLAVILNESAAKFLGYENIMDKKIYRLKDEATRTTTEYHVIGIVKDFNFSSLREQVRPLLMMYGSNNGGMTLKINTSDIQGLVSSIESQWKSIAPDLPFEYRFMDDDFDNLYKGERKIAELITIFTSMSILISCLGLFGLATFMAEQRTKEIGIRKVLGASVTGITTLLSKDFLKLVLVAVAIATPVAYYVTNQWLQGFAYRISLEWWVFACAGLLAIGIALVTVSFQAIRAAVANPVKSLRSE
jgi:putative ABC transport system permease protein